MKMALFYCVAFLMAFQFQLKLITTQCVEGDLLPIATNCGAFYHCSHGQLYFKECPAGLNFNPDLGVCDWPENVDCESITSEETTSTRGTTENITTTETETCTDTGDFCGYDCNYGCWFQDKEKRDQESIARGWHYKCNYSRFVGTCYCSSKDCESSDKCLPTSVDNEPPYVCPWPTH